MEGEKIYRTMSVHELVDFLLRSGDIDNRIYNFETMQMGSKIHAAYQEKQGNKYLSEVPLKDTFIRPKGVITLEGRADGIIVGGAYPIIDEIKSTVAPLNDFYTEQKEWHLGQAKCYALMYGEINNVRELGIRLTYISQRDDEKTVKEFHYDIEELRTDINSLLDEYLDFLEDLQKHEEYRNSSIKDLAFPFPSYRNGQRTMMKNVYKTIMDGGSFYMEAPTGIGKTMSALYPAIKAMEESKTEKIFYLTAKTTGRESAYDALTKLYNNGLKARDSVLKAKEKMCFLPGTPCNPEDCPFARGYYDKIKKVRKLALESHERFSVEYVQSLAATYTMCPFELSLDLSLYSDIIICDYNYLFDPIVYLERYFDEALEPDRYVALVDESHNLIDRGRSMYSSEVSTKMIVDAKASLKKVKAPGLKRSLTKMIDYLVQNGEGDAPVILDTFPKEILSRIDSIQRADKKAQQETPFRAPKAYQDMSRELHRLSVLSENFDHQVITYFTQSVDGPIFHFDCLDPSPYISDSLSRLKASIFFSATFSPIDFYKEAIGGDIEAPSVLLKSPFDPKNVSLTIVPNLSVRYKDRESTYESVASYLKKFVTKKVGNYFIYFPSYEYLRRIQDCLDLGDANIYIQEHSMREEDRSEFLSHFVADPKETTVGLLVLGGAFGEGVDLIGDRLSGVAIVGIGMPTISFERDLLRNYFDSKEKRGFAYAYLYPGINRVMQALGRLIRSETDRGAALLIDDRYLNREYREIYSRLYPSYSVAYSTFDLDLILDEFYKE